MTVNTPGSSTPPTTGSAPASTPARQRVLDAAAALFAERGYAGTSVRDIAERLGVTKAALYYHFPSKEQLLVELLRPVIARLTEVLDAHEARGPGADPADLVRGVVDALVDRGPLLASLDADPSAVSSTVDALDVPRLEERGVDLVAGADPEARLRAWCAFGAVRNGALALATAAAAQARPGASEHAAPLPVVPDGPQAREVVVQAAMAAMRPPTSTRRWSSDAG